MTRLRHKILFLGDSVTAGVRPGVTESQTFCAQFNGINGGVGGNNTADGLARLPALLETHQPKIVVVMFGLNDALNGPTGQTPAQYIHNLSEMHKKICKAHAKMVLCTPNGLGASYADRNIELKPYVEAVRNIACDKRVPLADVFSAFAQEALYRNGIDALLLDGQHPNAEGHALISVTLAQILGQP